MLKLRRTHEFPEIVCIERCTQSAGWPRTASTPPDLPQPGPRSRQGRPATRPPSPPRQESANRKRQTDPVPVAEDRSAAGGRPRRGPEPARDRGRPGPRRVRTPSRTPGPYRAPAVTAGGQDLQVTRYSPLRPRTAKQHEVGFEPLTRTAAAGLPPLPTREVVTGDGPRPRVKLVTIADRLQAPSSSPAMPPTCPKHRFTAVTHGQQRSVPTPADL
jgi:hypothetical protein